MAVRGFVGAFDYWYIRVMRKAVSKYRASHPNPRGGSLATSFPAITSIDFGPSFGMTKINVTARTRAHPPLAISAYLVLLKKGRLPLIEGRIVDVSPKLV
jgi:hypothetical protein